MNAVHWLSMAVLVLAGGIAWLTWQLIKLRNDWRSYKDRRETLMQKLADPVQIEAEFEQSAERMEAMLHGRLTMPRPDAGPPAKVWRPKAMRAAMPRRWNPPGDYDSRLR